MLDVCPYTFENHSKDKKGTFIALRVYTFTHVLLEVCQPFTNINIINQGKFCTVDLRGFFKGIEAAFGWEAKCLQDSKTRLIASI